MRESMGNAFVPGAADISPADQALIERRARLLGPAYRLQYQRPLHITRGEGVWLFDKEGNAYLDAYNNVPSVGHCHPYVVESIYLQTAILNTHTRYLHTDILDYAERLLATMPDAIGHMMFTCTGSEANDLACRIARAHTGGKGIIVTRYAYHGVTDAIAQLSPSLGEGVELGSHVRLVPPPDPRTGGAVAFASAVQEAIDDLARSGVAICALLVDTAFTSDGLFVDPPGLLGPAVEAVRSAGGLFIADEVQPGFGRTGQMWCFSRHDVVPDIVTLGKPMGNGYPIAGLALRPEVLASFANKVRYFNTFGGNPVAAMAGLAVLDVLRDEKLLANAARVGAMVKAGFSDIATRHDCVAEVRGAGLSLAVELRDAAGAPASALATDTVNGMRDRRVLLSVSGIDHNVLKIRPPLCFSIKNAERLLDVTEQTLTALGV